MSANGWITEEKELYMARLHRMDLSDPLVRDKAQQVRTVTECYCYSVEYVLTRRQWFLLH